MATFIEPTATAIKKALDAAFVPAEIDEDGDVRVEGQQLRGFILLPSDLPIVKFMFQFGCRHATDGHEVLRALNEFNREYRLVKAYWIKFGDHAAVRFESEFRVDGGLSPLTLVQTLRQMETIIVGAQSLHPHLA